MSSRTGARSAALALVLALPALLATLSALAETPTWVAPPVDVAALRVEDAANVGRDLPTRVGFPMKADIAPGRFGAWKEGTDGSLVWRAGIRSPGALWLVAGFGTFRLQEGGELRVGAPDGSILHGPFTHEDVRAHGQLWIPPVPGDELLVELRWPAKLADETPNLHLGTISHGYEPWGGIGRRDPPETDAGACNIDVNCPLGDNWQDQKRGVVNLLSGGSGYCSGSLVTNTDGDCRNFVLTAAHCLSSQSSAASTVFQFNFERPQCDAGTPPTDQTVSGSTLVATYSPSDVTLLEMDSDPLEEYQAFYNGWSRSTTPGSESWAIHHPNNDEKKISFNEDPLVDGQNYGPDHWRVTEWEQGTTEPGSSGSPLFDQNQRIVGQLHGGTASCSSITYDEYGKLDVSWEGGGTPSSRLSDWLDPSGSGAVTTDGLYWIDCQTPQPRLRYHAHLIDDSAGNGDGIVDPGETIVIEIDVINAGTLGATGVSGSLSSPNPLATVIDSASAYPDIAVDGVQRSLPDHFSFEVDPSFVCGDPLGFRIDLFANEEPGSWNSDFEVTTGTALVDTIFFDDMESGPGTWTTETLVADNRFSQVTSESRSPSTSWFVSDISSVSDAALVMEELTGLPVNAELRFWHRINAENNYDGGVLEYSLGGGAWVDAAPLIVEGGYNSTISTSYESPIGGREAWSGDNGAWQEVRVDLSSLADGDVRLRWRFATDSSVSDQGWWIDDVTVDVTEYACNGPVGLPGEASAPEGGGAPLTIAKDPGGYALAWSAPSDGGAAERYLLYQTALGVPVDAVCEADLGTGTSALLPALSENKGFLVVARNGAGDGPLGSESGGAARGGAKTPCP